MKVANIPAEAQVIAAMLSYPDERTRAAAWTLLKPYHFDDGVAAGRDPSITRKIYDMIASDFVASGRGIPHLDALRKIDLDADIRAWFESHEVQPTDPTTYRTLVDALTKAERHRKFLVTHTVIGRNLNDDTKPVNYAEIDNALEAAKRREADVLQRVTTSAARMEDARARGMYYLDPRRRHRCGLSTGWRVFDRVTGGLQPGQVCLVAANSGGCKSMGALQIGVHSFQLGRKVAYINLEMDEEELWLRRISNVTNTPFATVSNLSDSQQEAAWNDYAAHFQLSSHGIWDDYSRRNGDNTPVTMRDLDGQIPANYYNLVILDYISLLDREEKDEKLTEEQWLRRTVDRIKRFAKAKNCVVLLLAQLTKDGELAQAKSMKNGVDYMLKWKYEVVDGIRPPTIDVVIDKARSPKSTEVTFALDACRINCCRLPDHDGADADFQPPAVQAQEF